MYASTNHRQRSTRRKGLDTLHDPLPDSKMLSKYMEEKYRFDFFFALVGFHVNENEKKYNNTKQA